MSADDRFDELGKTLAASTSRRRFLKVAAAAAAGAVLSVVGAPEAAARKCRDFGQNCRSNAECCTRFCDPTFKCACPSNTELCGGQCVATTCSGGLTFDPTTCKCECLAPKVLCESGLCVTPTTCTQPGAVFDPATCECKCPSGTTGCNVTGGVNVCCTTGKCCGGTMGRPRVCCGAMQTCNAMTGLCV